MAVQAVQAAVPTRSNPKYTFADEKSMVAAMNEAIKLTGN